MKIVVLMQLYNVINVLKVLVLKIIITFKILKYKMFQVNKIL